MPNDVAHRILAARMASPVASAASLDLMFNEARTYSAFEDREVPLDLLQQAVALAQMGPTSMNCQPMRLAFLQRGAERAAILPLLAEGNRAKTEAAPMTAVVGFDLAFFEHLPRLFPHFEGARAVFADDPDLAEETAFRNGSIQGGYLILALRAVGLDCGPMSGFDRAAVSRAVFGYGTVQANFLINIGFGRPETLFPRQPRLGWSDTIIRSFAP
jgi:3-hydroxypropanoate dehydrogenase